MRPLKLLAYVSRSRRDVAEAFRNAYRSEFLPELLAATPQIRRCTVNLVDSALLGGLPGAKMPSENVSADEAYDGAVEYWVEAPASELGKIVHRIITGPGRVHAYWVEEHVAKEQSVSDAPSALRLISPCRPVARLSPVEVFVRWREHAERANRVHIGMSRYVQNWHLAPLTDDTPAAFGTPMLSFQSLNDWQQRFYGSDAGREEIAADVASFVGSFSPLLTREHRLK